MLRKQLCLLQTCLVTKFAVYEVKYVCSLVIPFILLLISLVMLLLQPSQSLLHFEQVHVTACFFPQCHAVIYNRETQPGILKSDS